ncbi:MAG TPA: type II toxin-antitoxin system PemK/MazF family toxin [Verrucomicrobiae bacterium]
MWWCALGANIGAEANGKHDHFERPVLILKKFNKEMFWGVPLTSKPKQPQFHSLVSHEAGQSWVALTQLKTFSTKRLLRRVGMVSADDFEYVQKRIASILLPL